MVRGMENPMNLYCSIHRFLLSEDSPTAVEYCVMIALIVVAAVAGITATSGGVSAWWSDIDSDLDAHGF